MSKKKKNSDNHIVPQENQDGITNRKSKLKNKNIGEDKSKMSDFDLFAPPPASDLQEEIVRGRYQWTNKYTKFFTALLVVVALVSAGAWYGHRTALASNSSASTRGSLASAFGGSGFGAGLGSGRGNRTSAGGSSTGFAFGGAGASGGGFSFGSSGKVTSVSHGTVTITLNNSTTTLAAGDRVTLIPRTMGVPATNAPTSQTPPATQTPPAIQTPTTKSKAPTSQSATSTPPTAKSSSATSPKKTGTSKTSSKPTVSGGGGGGRFSNPAFTKCLAANGVTLTPGVRPDRANPKVAAALQACFAKLGGGFGGPPGSTPGAQPGSQPGN